MSDLVDKQNTVYRTDFNPNSVIVLGNHYVAQNNIGELRYHITNFVNPSIQKSQELLDEIKNKDLEPISKCFETNTTCTYHGGTLRIHNMTITGDGFTVNEGTRWERTVPGLTSILIFDEKGNYISKEYKYGDNRDTYTTYHEDPDRPGYYLPQVYIYTEYRADETEMFQFFSLHPDLKTYFDRYYWDNGVVKGLRSYGDHNLSPGKECRDSTAVSVSCDSPYYFDKYLHPEP